MWEFGWEQEGELPATRTLGTNSLDVVWDVVGGDDFTFRWGDYCLRVERICQHYWWWCVYYKDGYAGFDEPTAWSEREAKSLAELCFVKHYVKNVLQGTLDTSRRR